MDGDEINNGGVGPNISLEEAQKIVAGKIHPRVTEERIKSKIFRVDYFRPKGSPLTICIIEMDNGFYIVGKACPASPENFDPHVGERYAYEDAFKQIWALEAYLLKERTPLNEGVAVGV